MVTKTKFLNSNPVDACAVPVRRPMPLDSTARMMHASCVKMHRVEAFFVESPRHGLDIRPLTALDGIR